MIPSRPKNISTIRMICDAVHERARDARRQADGAERRNGLIQCVFEAHMVCDAQKRRAEAGQQQHQNEQRRGVCNCLLRDPALHDHARSSCRARLTTRHSRITPTVAVLTPPAVEPEEPPTSISRSAHCLRHVRQRILVKGRKARRTQRHRLEQRCHQLLRHGQAADRAGIVPFQRGERRPRRRRSAPS